MDYGNEAGENGTKTGSVEGRNGGCPGGLALGQATVRQAHEAMPSARKMDFATVQTYLRRLEAKGYVRIRSRATPASTPPRSNRRW